MLARRRRYLPASRTTPTIDNPSAENAIDTAPPSGLTSVSLAQSLTSYRAHLLRLVTAICRPSGEKSKLWQRSSDLVCRPVVTSQTRTSCRASPSLVSNRRDAAKSVPSGEKASFVKSPNVSQRKTRLPDCTSQIATTPHLRTSGCGRGGKVLSVSPEQPVAISVPPGAKATTCGSRAGTNGAATARQ